LRLCLEYLSRAAGIETKEIWICIDRGKSLLREYYEVINDFRGQMDIQTRIRPEHSYRGNTFNTLEAYKEAYQTDAKFVYLVEDDVLVTQDFFQWHEAIQETGDYLCSVAYRCLRNAAARKDITDPEAYFTTACDFASIGCCWRRTRLAPVIEHAREEYYGNLEGYIMEHFHENRFFRCYTEQDGLIMRVLGATNGIVAWPYVPRCYHIGFAGYNRIRGPRLSYAELKETIHNTEKIAAASVDFQDIEPVPTEPVAAWDAKKLYRIQHFD
jgi:hypothetical protein